MIAANEVPDHTTIARFRQRHEAALAGLFGDVLNTLPLDHPRRTLAPRVGIEQKRDHHRRVVRRPAMTIETVDAIEPRQIHLLHRPNTNHARWPAGNHSRKLGGINNT